MHILSMLDHKSRLNCTYWYAIYLVICVRIDCTHSRSRVTYFTGCDTTRPGGGGGRPGVGLSSMLLSRCWASVGPADVAAWAVTGSWPGLYVNCSLHSNMQNISISVKTIIIIIITRDSPLSKHWLICFKLSPALSALWTQHCSGVKKEQPYNVCHSSRISYTRISQRDW